MTGGTTGFVFATSGVNYVDSVGDTVVYRAYRGSRKKSKQKRSLNACFLNMVAIESIARNGSVRS